MPKIVILKGLPGSGKTTWARKQTAKGTYTRINKDDLREMMHGQYHEDRETQILKARDSLMIQALRYGQNVIIDDTNFNPYHEERIREVADAQGNIDGQTYKVEVRFFNVSLKEAIRRDLQRPKSVGEAEIKKMYRQYIQATTPVTQDETKPQAIIMDLDGTLADLDGRDPYNASDSEYDKLNHFVYIAMQKYLKDGYKLILVTGRKGEYVEQTNKWLEKHGIKPDLFLMRGIGDKRKDWEVKREMFMDHILPDYYVEVAFEDRSRVAEMWRDLGIKTFQVADGDF